MRDIVGSAFAVGLALSPLPALAQSQTSAEPARGAASEDLPLGPENVARHGVVPGVGPTPGMILTVETPAAKCSRDAVKAADGLMTPMDAIATCNEAITSGAVPPPDMASTLVNRGVLLMTMEQPRDAKRDFEAALNYDPEHPEALVNRGAILLTEGKPKEALADLDRGIALGPERPERAFLSRAMAREDLKDVRGAYADYKQAEALKPGWAPVLNELSRFQVKAK